MEQNQAPHVYTAINKITAELAKVGIAKGRKNQQQGYSFRGIDDIYGALATLLAEHGLCVMPRVISRDCVERQTAKGGAIFYTTVFVEYDFISSMDGSKYTASVFGEAMDSADKSTNKAMSAAYKYACLQAFCIPTEGDNDADAHTPEPIAPRPQAPDERFVAALIEQITASPNMDDLRNLFTSNQSQLAALKAARPASYQAVQAAKDARKALLESVQPEHVGGLE